MCTAEEVVAKSGVVQTQEWVSGGEKVNLEMRPKRVSTS